jgi:enoyl-CoA hydratase
MEARMSELRPEQPVLVEREDPIAIVTINRPDKLNALNWGLVAEMATQLEQLDADDDIRCIILTGAGEKAFAAGADIAEMSTASPVQMATGGFESWDRIRRIKKPMIAAVGGYALGGGNELAMHADMIIAGENARFGQPEILLGVMCGAGGTQRLTHTLGKYRTMELCLTGKPMSAEEARSCGLVNRVVPAGQHLEEARKLAHEVAKQAPFAARFTKEAILAAFEMPLQEGLAYEKRLFALLFATEDQKEGMRAFLAKEQPSFKGR